ncbi:MAG: hypothetical protein F4X57_14480 [Chloroflexi bacterium]|nr:hypothetical protein [Chloroflexota bacterium]
MPVGDSDKVRNYGTQLVEEVRREGRTRITLRAGDIHSALRLTMAHGTVCQALGGVKFHKQAGVKLVGVDDSKAPSRAGANVYFEFEILPTAGNTKPLSRDELLSRLGYSALNSSPEVERQTERNINQDIREHIFELSPSEFQELIREYLKAKGFADAEMEIVIRMKI